MVEPDGGNGRFPGRGLSILNNLGLPELVAFSEEDYVRIALGLAGDAPRLAEFVADAATANAGVGAGWMGSGFCATDRGGLSRDVAKGAEKDEG